MEKKDRDNLAMAIANELLDNEILDENNFSHDTDALLQCVSGIILAHLKDYVIVSGNVL